MDILSHSVINGIEMLECDRKGLFIDARFKEIDISSLDFSHHGKIYIFKGEKASDKLQVTKSQIKVFSEMGYRLVEQHDYELKIEINNTGNISHSSLPIVCNDFSKIYSFKNLKISGCENAGLYLTSDIGSVNVNLKNIKDPSLAKATNRVLFKSNGSDINAVDIKHPTTADTINNKSTSLIIELSKNAKLNLKGTSLVILGRTSQYDKDILTKVSIEANGEVSFKYGTFYSKGMINYTLLKSSGDLILKTISTYCQKSPDYPMIDVKSLSSQKVSFNIGGGSSQFTCDFAIKEDSFSSPVEVYLHGDGKLHFRGDEIIGANGDVFQVNQGSININSNYLAIKPQLSEKYEGLSGHIDKDYFNLKALALEGNKYLTHAKIDYFKKIKAYRINSLFLETKTLLNKAFTIKIQDENKDYYDRYDYGNNNVDVNIVGLDIPDINRDVSSESLNDALISLDSGYDEKIQINILNCRFNKFLLTTKASVHLKDVSVDELIVNTNKEFELSNYHGELQEIPSSKKNPYVYKEANNKKQINISEYL